MEMPGGNSYYKEIGHSNADKMFPETKYTKQKAITLSSVVKKKSYPIPDLIKIDTQGSEIDILKGAKKTLENCKLLYLECPIIANFNNNNLTSIKTAQTNSLNYCNLLIFKKRFVVTIEYIFCGSF